MKREGWESNRDMKRKPKKGKFWCPGCDLNLISENRKCKICGIKEMRKRDRK